ncbi:hypothetical protein [Streptomyces halobius]|uniref:Uncharacterized protein n=1 Tax=Streptomyces halobius TaxID=2879846 RepID=A0ABY4LZ39_9ACTN|nr:hypothetical protein [Streptomyces halobius]UQA90769.1 hypothetical protein K9S39_01695 [Streptomyces halobius]
MSALAGRLKAQDILDEYRAHALNTLAKSHQAVAEAKQAGRAKLRHQPRYAVTEDTEQTAADAAEQARARTVDYLLNTRTRAWLTSRQPAPSKPPAQGQTAVYQAGAAKARAATTTAPTSLQAKAEASPGTPRSTRVRRLDRVEVDHMPATAQAEATARLRAQIAAEMPSLAAITAAHHGVTYEVPKAGSPS